MNLTAMDTDQGSDKEVEGLYLSPLLSSSLPFSCLSSALTVHQRYKMKINNIPFISVLKELKG